MATIDSTGLVTAVANGTATGTATTTTASGSATLAVAQEPDRFHRACDGRGQRNGHRDGHGGRKRGGGHRERHAVTGPSASLSVALSVIVRDLAMITDREALGALYHATDGDNWSRNDGWLTDAPLGEWFGVQVNDEGQIVGLGFSRNNLHGSLPPELGALSELTHSFDFRGNQLTGPIPAELGELSKLGHFHLGRNQLTGPIPPELGKLVNVGYMVLSGNSDLSGPLPRTFLNLQALDVFSISQTQVCVPTDEEFRNWFAGIRVFVAETCSTAKHYAALVRIVAARSDLETGWSLNWVSLPLGRERRAVDLHPVEASRSRQGAKVTGPRRMPPTLLT